MTLESFHRYVHTFPGVTENFPFDHEVLAIRVGNKIFALCPVETLPLRVNLKCDPERSVELRAEYQGIIPGYHMNKQQWNTVFLQDDVPDDLLRELIRHSYDLIFASLPKKVRLEIQPE